MCFCPEPFHTSCFIFFYDGLIQMHYTRQCLNAVFFLRREGQATIACKRNVYRLVSLPCNPIPIFLSTNSLAVTLLCAKKNPLTTKAMSYCNVGFHYVNHIAWYHSRQILQLVPIPKELAYPADISLLERGFAPLTFPRDPRIILTLISCHCLVFAS